MTGVYYADLFEINKYGCLIMGYGKSQTCKYYTGDNTKEIGLDSIRLEKDGNKLYGYADPFMGFLPLDKSQMKMSQIQYLIRMLNENETSELSCSNIVEIEKESYIKYCIHNILFNVTDAQRRILEFADLITDVDIKCIIVPWCKDMQAKGTLIAKYLK